MNRHWRVSVAVSERKVVRCHLLAAFLVIVLASGFAACSQARAQDALPDPNTATVSIGEPATVHVWNRPIVELRAKVGTLTPATRVEGIERRINNLPFDAPVDAIRTLPGTFGKISGEHGIELGKVDQGNAPSGRRAAGIGRSVAVRCDPTAAGRDS